MPCEQLHHSTFDHQLEPSQCKPQKEHPIVPAYQSCFTFFSSSGTDEDEEPNEGDDEVAGSQIEVETVVPYRESDSESEPEKLRSVSDFDLLSGSDEEESTASSTLWPGMAESSTHSATVMTTLCPIIGQAGGDAVADDQRRQSPGPQSCQAGLKVEDGAEALGHPSLGSDFRRKRSKYQNKLLKWFMTSLLENSF